MKKIILLFTILSLNFVSYSQTDTVKPHPTDQFIDSIVNAKIDQQLGNTPETKSLIPVMTGSTTGTDICIIIGFVIYMFLQYRSKKLRDPNTSFSLPTWLKDNWYNCVLFLLGVLYFFNDIGTMNTWGAISIGMAPNALIDLVGGFVEKMIVGKTKYERGS